MTQHDTTLPEIKITTMRETKVDLKQADHPLAIAKAWRASIPESSWFDSMKESFIVWLLDTKRKVIGYNLVGIGTLDSVVIHPREVFRAAIVQGASAIVISHNHPSGDPTPSEADIKITRDLIRASKILRIELLDHVIMGDQSSKHLTGFISLKELGYFYN